MSFPPYQNAGAGLGALGPVQAMSDRNEAQTYMANGGQMFAGGGIAKLAKGGLPKFVFDPKTQQYVITTDDTAEGALSTDLLPKYSYDPKTQRYTLLDSKTAAAKTASPIESTGGDGSSGSTGGWDNMSNAEKASYYAANPTMAAITQMGQKAFGMTGLGLLSRAVDPISWGEQSMIVRGVDPAYMGELNAQAQTNASQPGFDVGWGLGLGNTLGDQPGDYDNPGGGGYTSDQAGGGWGGNDSGYADGVGGVYAQGGITALMAQGGQSHLGDYSDGGRLLRGPGDGVSDSIPATIANKRPARLADGEFVVPARIVSELGNGSTEAGARKLYAMMDRIQKARSKTVGKDRVAVNSRADKNLPA